MYIYTLFPNPQKAAVCAAHTQENFITKMSCKTYIVTGFPDFPAAMGSRRLISSSETQGLQTTRLQATIHRLSTA